MIRLVICYGRLTNPESCVISNFVLFSHNLFNAAKTLQECCTGHR